MPPIECINRAARLVAPIFFMPLAACLSAERTPPAVPNLQAADISFQAERLLPDLPEAYLDVSPCQLDDGLEVGSLGTDAGMSLPVVSFAKEIARGDHGEVDSLLIWHEGKLLFESYFRRGRINYPHYQMSITKSYTALAIGRAIQLGHLTMADLDRPVVSFFDTLNLATLADGADRITLAQAMTMRSGIRLPPNKAMFLRKPTEAVQGNLQVRAMLEATRAIGPPPREFKYQGTDTALAMQALDVVVPGTAEQFIQAELLDKLGITSYAWVKDVSGLPKSAAGSSMRSRDMLKWGLLVLNQGRHQDEQLIPPEFIATATSPLCSVAKETSYGFFFWRHTAIVDDKPVDCITCRGAGGQFIFLIPAQKLIAVVTAHNKGMGPLLQELPRRLLAAF